MNIIMLAYPNMTQLDLTGPLEVLNMSNAFNIQLVWKSLDFIHCGALTIVPSHTFNDCAQADIVFVPGGVGQMDLMKDKEVLEFLKKQASTAQYITSVCTGSLVLAAAGLLKGYKATSHWQYLEQLRYFGVEPVSERVVVDRNRITGAGVTSGIDFALKLIETIMGQQRAKEIQLFLEYDPAPPFNSGSPKTADEETITAVRQKTAGILEKRGQLAKEVGQTVYKA